MPLYDCMLLLKPSVKKEALMELVARLVARVGKHVYTKNGVLTDLKSFGTMQLGYAIKKLDGRYFQSTSLKMANISNRSREMNVSTYIMYRLNYLIYELH
ncbi:hypothetical protein ACOSQ3_013916 [Xanthoceras sorbifolium]